MARNRRAKREPTPRSGKRRATQHVLGALGNLTASATAFVIAARSGLPGHHSLGIAANILGFAGGVQAGLVEDLPQTGVGQLAVGVIGTTATSVPVVNYFETGEIVSSSEVFGSIALGTAVGKGIRRGAQAVSDRRKPKPKPGGLKS